MPKATTSRATKSRSLLVLPRRDPKPKAPGRLASLFEKRKRLIGMRVTLERLERQWEEDRDQILEELATDEAALY